jgi:hypothetical protein
MTKMAGAGVLPAPAVYKPLQIRVASGQHGGKARHFFLAATPRARLFKTPIVADGFQRAFAVDLFLQTAQRAINGLAFF